MNGGLMKTRMSNNNERNFSNIWFGDENSPWRPEREGTLRIKDSESITSRIKKPNWNKHANKDLVSQIDETISSLIGQGDIKLPKEL